MHLDRQRLPEDGGSENEGPSTEPAVAPSEPSLTVVPGVIEPGPTHAALRQSGAFLKSENPLALLLAGTAATLGYLPVAVIDWYPGWLVAMIVWGVTFLATVSLNNPVLLPYREWLRGAARNTGLNEVNLLGVLISLAAAIVAGVTGSWGTMIVPMALLLGFVRLLLGGPQLRELRPLAVIDLTAMDDDDEGVWPVDPDDPDLVYRDFGWTVRALSVVNAHYERIPVSESAYRAKRASNPFSLGEWPEHGLMARWVTDGHTKDVVRAAARIRELSGECRYSSFGEMSSVLAFAQSVKYMSDEETRGRAEFWQYPVETMYDQSGDCEDSTILTAALLRQLGHGVVILILPGHAAVGIEAPEGIGGDFVTHNGVKYLYGETTDEGWRIGDLPSHYIGAEVTILPVSPLRSSK